MPASCMGIFHFCIKQWELKVRSGAERIFNRSLLLKGGIPLQLCQQEDTSSFTLRHIWVWMLSPLAAQWLWESWLFFSEFRPSHLECEVNAANLTALWWRQERTHKEDLANSWSFFMFLSLPFLSHTATALPGAFYEQAQAYAPSESALLSFGSWSLSDYGLDPAIPLGCFPILIPLKLWPWPS